MLIPGGCRIRRCCVMRKSVAICRVFVRSCAGLAMMTAFMSLTYDAAVVCLVVSISSEMRNAAGIN